MRLTALLPPPPTPITLMRAPARLSAVERQPSSRRRFSASVGCVCRRSAIPCVLLPRRPARGIQSDLEEFLEQHAQPAGHAAERAGSDRPAPARRRWFRCAYITSPTAVANAGLLT